MDPLTPEQKKELSVWATKRDNLLHKIGVLSTQLEEKEKKNIELSETRTEIETAINKGLGRLAQIEEQESGRAKLIPKEIADLEKQKIILQTEVPALQKEVGGLKSEKNILIEVIDNLKKVHTDVFDRVGALDKIVEHVTRVSEGNIADFKGFFRELKETVQDIIDGNKKVKAETDLMIAKVPKILREHSNPIRIIRPILNKKRLVAKGDIPK
jgi:chromosome segregation ATPase